MTSLEIRDPRLAAVVGAEVTFEKIASGCLFTEGPLWHPRGQLSALERHAGRSPAPLVGRRTA